MTACNLFLGQRAAYLIADRGCFDDNGRIVGERYKPLRSRRLRMAITVAGRDCIWTEDDGERDPLRERLTHLLETAADQVAALAAAPALFAEAHEEMIERGFEGASVFGCIGLWSASSDEPEGFVIASPGNGFPGEPVAPFELAGAWRAAAPPVDRSFWPEGDVTSESALRLVEAQRNTPSTNGMFWVGVAADLVTIDAEGVRTQMICRWPRDRVGRKIDPQGPLRRALNWLRG